MELRHPYPGILTECGISFGGDQKRSENAVMQRCGCGVIAAADLLLYLDRWHPDCRMMPLQNVRQSSALTEVQYEALTDRLRKKYFPLIDPLGVNGLTLMLGLNRIFRRWEIPYTARWGVPWAIFWETMEEMLRQDLPVILAVGPNFPLLWQKNQLSMERDAAGPLRQEVHVRAHYVTVTAMDEERIIVSSWGKRYIVDRKEYSRYVRQSSSPLVSNLLWLRPKRRS